MKEAFCIGMMLGIVVGAVIVNSNKQAANLVEKGKDAVKKQLENL